MVHQPTKSGRERARHLFTSRLYEIAAEANDPAIRDHILDKAFVSRSFEFSEPLHAIKGLAKFDTAHAIEAIELGFQPVVGLGRCCGLDLVSGGVVSDVSSAIWIEASIANPWAIRFRFHWCLAPS